MTKHFILFLCVLFAMRLNAQTDTTADATFTVEKPVTEALVFTFVEQNPEYPGGDGELIKFISKNLRYPQMEKDNKIQGKVLVRFVVMEDGSVNDVTVMRSVSPGLDKEAVRVVKLLKGFTPGKQQGKPVRVYFNFPVYFKL